MSLTRRFDNGFAEAHAILRKLRHLSNGARNKEAIMAALDDMSNAVSALETAATAAVNEINTLKSGDDETALAALTARVSTVASNLSAAAPTPAT